MAKKFKEEKDFRKLHHREAKTDTDKIEKLEAQIVLLFEKLSELENKMRMLELFAK